MSYATLQLLVKKKENMMVLVPLRYRDIWRPNFRVNSWTWSHGNSVTHTASILKIVEQMLVIQHKKVMQTLRCGAAITGRKHGISIAERQERRVPDQTTEVRSFSFANSNFHSSVLCLLIKMPIQLTHGYIKWNYVLNWLSRDVWSSRSLFKSSATPFACKFEVAMLVLYFPAMSSFHFYQSSLHLIPMLVSFLCCSRKLWKYSLLRQ